MLSDIIWLQAVTQYLGGGACSAAVLQAWPGDQQKCGDLIIKLRRSEECTLWQIGRAKPIINYQQWRLPALMWQNDSLCRGRVKCKNIFSVKLCITTFLIEANDFFFFLDSNFVFCTSVQSKKDWGEKYFLYIQDWGCGSFCKHYHPFFTYLFSSHLWMKKLLLCRREMQVW